MRSLPTPCVRLLRQQHGVISRRQLLANDVSRAHIDELRSSGELISVHPGVYRHAAAPEGFASAHVALQLSMRCVASHRSAAHLHQLEPFDRAPTPEVTVPHGRPRIRGAAIIHQTTQFDRLDPVCVDGIWATGLERTLLDLAAVAPFPDVLGAIDAARRDGRTSWHDMDQCLKRHARRGRNGVQPFRRALLRIAGADTPALSTWSHRVSEFLTASGTPPPTLEHRVVDRAGALLGIADLAWPDRLVAIELDSIAFHHDRISFTRDRRRRNAMVASGWTVINVSWEMWRGEPGQLLGQINRLISIDRSRPATS